MDLQRVPCILTFNSSIPLDIFVLLLGLFLVLSFKVQVGKQS